MPPPPPAKRPGVPRLSFKARSGSGPGEHHDAEEGDSDGGGGHLGLGQRGHEWEEGDLGAITAAHGGQDHVGTEQR